MPVPNELRDAHVVIRTLLPRGRTQLTHSLVRKIFAQVLLSQFCDLAQLAALKIDGFISLSGKAEQITEPRPIAPKQIPMFEEAEEEVGFPKEHSFFSQVDKILRRYELTKKARNRGKVIVSRESWRNFFSAKTVAKLVHSRAKTLVLLPEESYVELFRKSVPGRFMERVVKFSADAPTRELAILERKLLEPDGTIVFGKRSANFLNFYARFDEVIILDPMSPYFRSEAYPHYCVLFNLYIYSLVMPIRVRIIPLTPFPPLRTFRSIKVNAYPLKGSSDERIHRTIDLLANIHTSGAKKTLVFNDAVGFGQQIACPNCGERIFCPTCNRGLTYSLNKRKFICGYCKFSSGSLYCPNCGRKELAIQLLGVEGMAQLLRKRLRELREPPRPRVGALYEERRGKIRVPNLARTDILVGTSTLFSPLVFYQPDNIVYIARRLNRKGTTPPFEELMEEEIYRLHSLYAGKGTSLHIIGDYAVVGAVKKLFGKAREKAIREAMKVKEASLLPPFGVMVGFTAYGANKDSLESFVSQALGQVELLHKPRWVERGEALPGREVGRWVVHGQFCVDAPDIGLLSELRTQGKNRRVDLVFTPHYY